MPNWRQCLISTEWVKRCRCPEPQNHMLRVKGPRPHKAELFQLWCGPIRGRRLWGETQRAPQHTNPSKNLLTMANESGSGPHNRLGISRRYTAPLPPFFSSTFIIIAVNFIAAIIISLINITINFSFMTTVAPQFTLVVVKYKFIQIFGCSEKLSWINDMYILGCCVYNLISQVLCWRGLYVVVCWVVVTLLCFSIMCYSKALRSNWKANIVRHVPRIMSHCCIYMHAILQCLFLVWLCCSH